MMKKINLKDFSFIILGIGLGIIFASIAFYFNPTIKYKDYSKEEIISKYEEMVLTDMRNKESKSTTKNENDITKKTVKSFKIEKGESSGVIIQRLYNEGIISDKEEFIDKVNERNVSKKFQYGEYKIQLPIDYNELIDLIIVK